MTGFGCALQCGFVVFAFEFIHRALHQSSHGGSLVSNASSVFQRPSKISLRGVMHFATAFKVTQSQEASAFARSISDLLCQLQGALKPYVRGGTVAEQFIKATRVIQSFYKFPLQAGVL